MAGKPRIAIVGAGNLGSALAISLHRARYKIDALISRYSSSSRRKVQRFAKEIEARVLAGSMVNAHANLFWFCVPDSEIHRTASSFAHQQVEWKGKIVLHSSGALTSDTLAMLRRRGAAVASAHPMMTFVGGEFLEKSKPIFAGVPFAIEGDAAAVKAAQRIVKDLGGIAYSIHKSDKAAYHAWGTFASPLMTALFVSAEQVAALASVEGKSARRRMLPILQQTLTNYATHDAADAFSGPIIRGEVETVKRHLKVLRTNPIAYDVYRSLGRAALEYLPGKNKAAMKKLLASRSKRKAYPDRA
jgi:predicted short-subunit dehydrogenase-like oxidoreductase (DUF2520 family)